MRSKADLLAHQQEYLDDIFSLTDDEAEETAEAFSLEARAKAANLADKKTATAEAAAEVIWDLVVGSNPESLGCCTHNLRLRILAGKETAMLCRGGVGDQQATRGQRAWELS